jgi:hypothetical protein
VQKLLDRCVKLENGILRAMLTALPSTSFSRKTKARFSGLTV